MCCIPGGRHRPVTSMFELTQEWEFDRSVAILKPPVEISNLLAGRHLALVRAVGLLGTPKDEKVAIIPSNRRQHLNIHGVIDLETGKTQMLEVPTVDANSTIALLVAVLSAYTTMCRIHVFLDWARYHQQWLVREGQRITLHFVPALSPHLNPIQRLWGCHAPKRHP